MSRNWAEQREARRAGRRILAVVAAVVIVVLFLCLGFAPSVVNSVLSSSGTGTRDDESQSFGTYGCQPIAVGNLPQVSDFSAAQLSNAKVIIEVGRQMKIPPRGWVIALGTALQESYLRNLANDNPAYPTVVQLSMALPHDGVASDHDSVGLFQQRPIEGDGGWGTVKELMTPAISAKKFYEKMIKVDSWQGRRLTDVAQEVQISGFPDAYQKHEPLAKLLVTQLAPVKAEGKTVEQPAAQFDECAPFGEVSADGWTNPTAGEVGSGFRTSDRPDHNGVDVMAPRNTPIRAAASGMVKEVICNVSAGSCDEDGSPEIGGCGWYVEIDHGAGLWTRYCHMVRQPSVTVGQRVTAGAIIGYVGSSGNSSGPHLHFEVHTSADAIDPVAFMLTRGAPLGVPATARGASAD